LSNCGRNRRPNWRRWLVGENGTGTGNGSGNGTGSDNGNGNGNDNGNGSGTSNREGGQQVSHLSSRSESSRKGTAGGNWADGRPIVVGDGAMDGVSPDILTHASIMDGSIKYKTLKKLKLQVLCGNLLDHIEDLE
jgi:hypothetical protein